MIAAVIWVVASFVVAPLIGAFIRAGTSTPTPTPPATRTVRTAQR